MKTEGRITAIELGGCDSDALAAFCATFPSCAGVTIPDLDAGPMRASAVVGSAPQSGRVEAGFENGEWAWVDLISYTSERRFRYARHGFAVRIDFGATGSVEAASAFLSAMPQALRDFTCLVWHYEDGQVIGRRMTISEVITSIPVGHGTVHVDS